MSELKAMLRRHEKEIDALRRDCPHKGLFIKLDHSQVGCGSGYPRIDIVCPNCGKMKIIFRDHKEKAKPKATFARQLGFEDQRWTNIRHEYELDKKP